MEVKYRDKRAEIKFCLLKKKDLKSVLAIQKECGLSPWTEIDYLKEIERKDSIALTARTENEKVIGFAVVRLLLDADLSVKDKINYASSEIFNIAVKKSFQQKGIGQKLFDEIIYKLREKKVPEIWLEVRESNLKAIKFYEKNGFIKQSVRKHYYSNPPENARILQLLLNYEN